MRQDFILSILHTKKELVEEFSKNFPYNLLSDELVDKIEEKLGKSFFNSIKRFIFEYPYTEKEWREIYSLHYCKTNYEETKPFVFRIHLVDKNIKNIDEVDLNSYLGYVTVRPLPTNFISKIVMKPNKRFYNLEDTEGLFMIATNQKVHIGNNEIEFLAFPFFSQDSMVTVCAHADILMVGGIMHDKYGLNELSVEKLVSGIIPSDTGRKIPSEGGINMEQIARCLQENRWYARIKGWFSNKNYITAANNAEEIIQHIDASIESGIPCILAFNRHVVVIVGHTINKKRERDYILFDDSGHHFKYTFDEPEAKFSINVSAKKLKEKLINVEGDIYLLCPEFERVHFPLKSVNTMMGKVSIGMKQIGENKLVEVINNKKYRIILVDVKELKRFFSKNNINTFNKYNFPHYIWCVELYLEERGNPDDLLGYIFFDASAHKQDYFYSYIQDCNGTLIIKPEGVREDRVMSLLEEF